MPKSLVPQQMYVCKASAGTGKTYTLAAHYIALLMSGVSSANILAVTFTNKATSEMKQRILTYLNAIANELSVPETLDFLGHVRRMSKVRGLPELSDDEYSRRAKRLLADNLSNFDNLRVTTIDSFLQTLLSGLAQVLGKAAGYGVDLDTKHAITQAVDEVLSVDVAQNKDIRTMVQHCLNARLDNEEKWDLRPSLIRMVEQVYQESVQVIHHSIPLPSEEHPTYAKLLKDYRNQLANFRESADFKTLSQLYSQTRNYEQEQSIDAPYKADFYSFIKRVGQSVLAGGADAQLGVKDMFRGLGNRALNNLEKIKTEQIRLEMERMHQLCCNLRPRYLKWRICREYLNDLLLVGYVVERIHAAQRQNNTMLLAETANALMESMDQHDAEFVLLKAGIRYRHLMLDEFQDTSTLQWGNFRRLIEEAVSQGGSALIVGDVKQSIYRWRNGDFEIMNGLNSPQCEPYLASYFNPQPLSRNFRSRRNVVDFNLRTFYALAQQEAEDNEVVQSMYDEGFSPENENSVDSFYNTRKSGGYVCLREFNPDDYKQQFETKAERNLHAREQLLIHMFQQMEMLLSPDYGYRPKDMLILCRGKSEGKQVMRVFRRLKQLRDQYPNLYRADKIVSADSFLLESSVAVNTIISGLKYLLLQDKVAATYITVNQPHVDLSSILALDTELPLSDLVEQITRICLCPDGYYHGEDIAFLNCLRDKIRSYIGSFGSNLRDFLQYWDDKMHLDAIPATDIDAIRVMTIHKSKGLQAKNVFIPFCTWEQETGGGKKETIWCETDDLFLDDAHTIHARIPVAFNSAMEEVPCLENVYQTERRKQRIDALNLLYVACTRAEDNLFVLVYKDANTAGSWLTDLYGAEQEWGSVQTKDQDKDNAPHISQPFDFDQVEVLDATYRSTDASVQFRQSQMARQMLLQRNEQPDANAENIEFGNVCHAILQNVRTAKDLDPVIAQFLRRGLIPEEHRDFIYKLLHRLVNHPVAGQWFSNQWRVLREDTVLSLVSVNGQPEVIDRRMDRVMIHDDEVIVLDYKFAGQKDAYLAQVREYIGLLRRMGYSSVRGYLWYAFANQLVEVSSD